MESIYFLLPIALVFVAIGLYLFFWAVDKNQFDDLDNEAQRILFDEEPKAKQTSNTTTEKKDQ